MYLSFAYAFTKHWARPRTYSKMPLLRLLLKGIKFAKGERAKPKCNVIMLSLLKALKGALTLLFLRHAWPVDVMDAFTTAFLGFLRASEFCSQSQSFFNPHRTLLVCHFTLLSEVAINTKASNGDQFTKGCQVVLLCLENPYNFFSRYNTHTLMPSSG